MSLAAALKKGLETADSIGNWDPFAEEGKAAPTPARSTAVAPRGPANTNASVRTLAARTAEPAAGQSARKSISTVPGGEKQAVSRMPTAEQPSRPAKPQAAAATRQSHQSQPTRDQARKPAAKPAQRSSWLHDAMPGGQVNAAQYVRELERFAAEENRRAVSDVVMEVNQSEVEGVVRHAARIKGRYLAKLLDVGNKAKSGVMEAEVNELTRYRETYEELARGLGILKSAIEAGDVSVSGTVRR
ncbi:MAG: hypothetical protein RLO01_14480 [Thalassobaculaceae bacterium]